MARVRITVASGAGEAFVVRGRTAAGRDAAVAWADGAFDDPSGAAAALVAAGAEVCATPTGPCFAAAAEPSHVALLTARAALARVDAVEGGDGARAELELLCRVPEGASA